MGSLPRSKSPVNSSMISALSRTWRRCRRANPRQSPPCTTSYIPQVHEPPGVLRRARRGLAVFLRPRRRRRAGHIATLLTVAELTEPFQSKKTGLFQRDFFNGDLINGRLVLASVIDGAEKSVLGRRGGSGRGSREGRRGILLQSMRTIIEQPCAQS